MNQRRKAESHVKYSSFDLTTRIHHTFFSYATLSPPLPLLSQSQEKRVCEIERKKKERKKLRACYFITLSFFFSFPFFPSFLLPSFLYLLQTLSLSLLPSLPSFHSRRPTLKESELKPLIDNSGSVECY